MTGFRPVAGLSRAERAWVGALVAGHPVFALYWDAAVDAAAAGDRSRSARLEPEGAILGIAFDGLSIYTPIGAVGDAALLSLTTDPRPLELHLTPEQAERLRPACGGRQTSHCIEPALRSCPLSSRPSRPDPRTPRSPWACDTTIPHRHALVAAARNRPPMQSAGQTNAM